MEKAVLVGVFTDRRTGDVTPEDSLEELGRLASSAGAVVTSVLTQERSAPDPKYYLGRGKVEELSLLAAGDGADLIIFDQDLSPAQQGNIEEACGLKVLDRTGLILDIFAQRARTREGKLQVELAQLEYLFPRLVGRHRELSRLGGGIGTRGPGEKKIEMDRRRIKRRISVLTADLENVEKQRSLYRRARRKASLPVAALVGYTNAGKSSLLHALTKADVRREDRLFSTLDPTTRRLRLPGGGMVLLTDTVGFIRNIPHQLIASFKSTLEEVVSSDLILHVIDLSRPDHERQVQVVRDVLAEIGAGEKAVLEIYNKIDLIPDRDRRERMERRHPDAIFISCKTRESLAAFPRFLEYNLRMEAQRGETGEPSPAGGPRATMKEEWRGSRS